MSTNSVINLTDQQPDWPAYAGEPGRAVRKIVLGRTPGESGEDKKPLAIQALPNHFCDLFPRLTHLYLWGIQGLSALPELPPGLECLDTRGCPNLASLTSLPATLDELILDDCAKLHQLPELAGKSLPKLRELSLKGCGAVPERWINQALGAAPELHHFDASGCRQLTRVLRWPAGLDRIELNDCAALKTLPAKWPVRLRRLGLRNTSELAVLPDFFDEATQLPRDAALDYLDLAGARGLRSLPAHWGQPRTLFLYGSGVTTPPVSEHGSKEDENVAAGTRAFFADVQLTGKGEVKRCKLLLLGNGSAGKTCLSLALQPGGDPAEAARLGSTHGIQFREWELDAPVGDTIAPVQLQLWDFGGQEIYHNTHRLFMGAGAVFIVVWKPEQDGRQPKGQDNGFHDTWRPLRYWLDFIHLACPQNPRIAIVCSHQTVPTPELEGRWRVAVGEEHARNCPCFYVDSLSRAGDLPALNEWLAGAVGGVVRAQGVAVPAYWELAQNLVQGWVRAIKADPDAARIKPQMALAEFQQQLAGHLEAETRRDAEGRYVKLREALAAGSFKLDPERTRRTLLFLTHSGWLYWDARLAEERVIIGQEWALAGIYAVLDRKADRPVFQSLTASNGRFTLRELGQRAWTAGGYSTKEQQLLLSFMEKCGLCFKILTREESWREEDVYVSFEHLPSAVELGLAVEFERRLPDLPVQTLVLKDRRMHRLHWQKFLTEAGAYYGKYATYARDGLYLENQEGEKLLILCAIEPSGLGGSIKIQVGAREPLERLRAVREQLQDLLPGAVAVAVGDEFETLGTSPAKVLPVPPLTKGSTSFKGALPAFIQGEEEEVGRIRSIERGGDPRLPCESGPATGVKNQQVEVFLSYAWDPPVPGGQPGIPQGYEEPVNAIEKFLKTLKQPVVKVIRDKNEMKFGNSLKNFMASYSKTDHVIMIHSDRYWKSPLCMFELWMVNDGLIKHEGKGHKGLKEVLIPVEHLNSGITSVENRKKYIKFWKTIKDAPEMLGWDTDKLKVIASSIIFYYAENLSGMLDLNLRWSDGPEKVLAAIAARLNPPPKPPDPAK